MAEKRMFSQKVICTDNFLLLPPITQNVYIQLNMKADDDGFISSALTTARLCGGGINDLDELVKQDFLIRFEKNVFLVKQWRLNNNKIQSDRYKSTIYPEFMQQVELDGNNIYRSKGDCKQDVNNTLTGNIQDDNNNKEYVNNALPTSKQDGNIPLSQSSVEKNRLDERRKDKSPAALAAYDPSPNLRNNRTTTTGPVIHKESKESSKKGSPLPPMDDDVMYSAYIKPSEDDFNKTIMMIWSSGYNTNEEQNKQIKNIIAGHKKQKDA